MAAAGGVRRREDCLMALPSFFLRVQDSLTEALPQATREALIKVLDSSSPGIRLEPGFEIAGEFMVNLAARIYPRLFLLGDPEQVHRAAELATKINPLIAIEESGRPDHIASVGLSTLEDEIRIVAAGWTVGGEVLSSSTASPIAQGVAACLAMSGVFARVFGDYLESDSRWASPLPSWQLVEDPAFDPSAVSFGTVHLAGVGAVGQAAIWGLLQSNCEGEVVVVDPEEIEESNLQRYVLAFPEEVGRPKVKLVKRLSTKGRLRIHGYKQSWHDFFSQQPPNRVGDVLLGLDSARDRIAVQAGLPRHVFNAWTQAADLGVTVHKEFGKEVCVACLYPPRKKEPTYITVARAFGLDPSKTLAYMSSPQPIAQPLSPELFERWAQMPVPHVIDHQVRSTSLLEDLRRAVPDDDLSRWANLPLRDLYREAICAGALLQYASSDSRLVHVPLAPQSAFAGILLALAFLADSAGLKVPRETRVDLLSYRGPAFPPTVRRKDCICSDDDFVTRWREKWGS